MGGYDWLGVWLEWGDDAYGNLGGEGEGEELQVGPASSQNGVRSKLMP